MLRASRALIPASGARSRAKPPCPRVPARAPPEPEAVGRQRGGAPRTGGGAVTRVPRDPALGLRPRKPEAAAGVVPAGGGEAAVCDLGLGNPVMDQDPTVVRRRASLLRWLLLLLPLWSRLALGALPFGSSPRRILLDLLSEQQLLEVEDLTISLLRGGGLGPLTLPPDLPNLDPECQELLLDFANSSAELTGCLVRSARPVRICQTCHLLFQQVVSKMDNISRSVGVGRGTHPAPMPCRAGRGEGCNDGQLRRLQFFQP